MSVPRGDNDDIPIELRAIRDQQGSLPAAGNLPTQPATAPAVRFSRIRLPGIAIALLLAIHALLLGWQAWRYSPTIDEPAHLAAGISHWKFGRFDLYRVNPPLVRLVAGLPMLVVEPQTDWSAFTEAPYARPEFPIGTALANANGFDSFWYFTLARWICIPFNLIGGYFCYRWAHELYDVAQCPDLVHGPSPLQHQPLPGAQHQLERPAHWAGLMALALWCFCPNILGNGALITPDVAAAAFGVMAGYCFWQWLRVPGWIAASVAGLTLGLAELTKSTWIILFGLWPALWLIWMICRRQSVQPRAAPSLPTGESAIANPQSEIRNPKSFLQLAAILAIAVYILNLGYGFESSFQRLGKFRFISRTLGGTEAHTTPGNRFAGTWLASLPVPVPANYLAGIDVQKYDFEKKKWSYLRGKQKLGGWWYYYLYAMLVKVPIGTLLLFALTCVVATIRCAASLWRAWRRQPPGLPPPNQPIHEHSASVSPAPADPAAAAPAILHLPSTILHPPFSFLDTLTLLAPAIAVLILISAETGFSRYLRYALPCFPFVFIWVSQLVCLPPFARGGRGGSRAIAECGLRIANWRARFAIPLVAWLALTAATVSSLAVFPHSLAYFNEWAGGPTQGHAHLLDGNIDWGQDLLELKRWYNANPEARPLYLKFMALFDPKISGMQFERLPRRNVDPQRPSEPPADIRPAPGWYAISVNELYSYKHFGDHPDDCAWFRQRQPLARAGYSIVIFHVPAE